jgi:hypothetical protein
MTPHLTPRTSPALALLALVLLGLLPSLAAAQTPPLIISEFRVRGWEGSADEFVEIYNASDAPVTVSPADNSAGYALVASDGVARFVIPAGTVIPARAHFLGCNATGYSLDAYAVCDAGYVADIGHDAGLALFKTSNPAGFTPANRLDAAGPSTAPALYREGAGLPLLFGFYIDYSWRRDLCAMTAVGFCAADGFPKDTADNAADFRFADTAGTQDGAGQRLGAPGPENLSSPGRLASNAGLFRIPLDPNVALSAPPNRERSFVAGPSASTFGTLTFRRTFTNETHAKITRLRFRIIHLPTFPEPAGTADLRALSSRDAVVATSTRNVNVRGATLEQPPAQAYGGGLNASLAAVSVTPAAPLAPGESLNIQLRFGVEQPGDYRFAVVVETLPFTGSAVWIVTGNTETDGDTEGFN